MSQLAPPGSSVYASNTLNVGDGTWDSQRNTFLLPNLMGVNFETMRYNGMGNRFKNMPGYHGLIRAHGVIAAIVFLGLVPVGILIARFYSRSPYWALRIHIWMQVVTLFLTTVVFVTGWFAVGPKRSLTNPHHGIGLALYVMIIAQTLWGWLVHKRQKGRRRLHLPLDLMLHNWLGWTIALLGIAQIPLGLTLYGSPQSLFILFALAAFGLLFAYFVLSYLHQRRVAADYDSRGSYSAGPDVVDDGHGRSGFGRLATMGAAGAGLAVLGRRLSRRRSRSRSPIDDRTEETSYITEKSERGGGGWGKRILQVGAVAGAAGLAKRFFDKRRGRRESDSESGRYHPAHTVTDSYTDDYSVSRAEEGRPPPPPPAHQNRYDGPSHHPHSDYTETEFTQDNEGGHGARNALFGAGAFAAVKGFFKNRSDKREERRLEEIRQADLESERIIRANSQRRYTGDGRGPRRHERRHSPVSDITGPSDRQAVHSHAAELPPVPPIHDDPSGSDTITSIGPSNRPHPSADPALAAGAAAGPSSHRRRSGDHESVESPPVSIKVKLHNEGRRVTLRRLTGEEASANREARRRDRTRSSHRRRESSLSGAEDDHWRRVEEQERRQEEEIRRRGDGPPPHPPPPAAESALSPGPGSSAPLSALEDRLSPLPPPPIPGAGGMNSATASTDMSGSFASRSGRRRAERRTQARQARHGVEFT